MVRVELTFTSWGKIKVFEFADFLRVCGPVYGFAGGGGGGGVSKFKWFL